MQWNGNDNFQKEFAPSLPKIRKTNSVTVTDNLGMIFPLANVHVYPPLPSSCQYSSPVASSSYGFQYYGKYPGMPVYPMPQMLRPYGMDRGTGGKAVEG